MNELISGVPLKVEFADENDIQKNFYMAVPKGDKEITLQIQPIISDYKPSEKFKPILYYTFLKNGAKLAKSGEIDFPPSGNR